VPFQLIRYTYEEADRIIGVAQLGVEIFLVLFQYTLHVPRYVDGIDNFWKTAVDYTEFTLHLQMTHNGAIIK
jgi:hypothetical protein